MNSENVESQVAKSEFEVLLAEVFAREEERRAAFEAHDKALEDARATGDEQRISEVIETHRPLISAALQAENEALNKLQSKGAEGEAAKGVSAGQI